MGQVSEKVAAAALLLGLAFTAGCEDRRYVEPVVPPPVKGAPALEIPPVRPGVDVEVNTPAGRVDVDGANASPAAPHRDIKVDVGGGNVEIDVDGKPLVERIRERREERNLPPAPTPVP
jgi:hypothetical protein